MKTVTKSMLFIAATICLIIVFGAGWWLSHSTSPSAQSKNKTLAAKTPLYWVAPMNPNYRSDKPGKSPMGMDLVPVYSQPDQAGTIKISPTVESNLGVRTALVKRHVFQQKIRTVGYITPDENSLQTVSLYTDGWVKNLQIKSVGEQVKKHQLLFELYSPLLVSAQEEYLLALKHKDNHLIRAGKQKLMTLGMSTKDIDLLKQRQEIKKNIPIYAPQSGYIVHLHVREGMHIKPATPLMSIANLSNVWIIAEVYEQQASLLKLNQPVKARSHSLPGQTIIGKIDYIYPTLNMKTRTVSVRLVLKNPGYKLKPNMYADITIDSGKSKPIIAIPKEALIQLGDTDRVILALGNGTFKPVEVTVGRYNHDFVEIKEGLKPGQKVVTSAQFLLDSESNLKAGLSRLNADKNKPGSFEKNHKQMGH